MTGERGDGGAVKLQLRLMGEFSLEHRGNVPVPIVSRKNRALLAILALSSGHRVTREKLAGLLWGEHPEEAARNSLRQALAVLRKDLDLVAPALVEVHDDQIILRAESIAIDALELLGAIGCGDAASLRSAVRRLRGEFLADVSLAEDGFNDWLAEQRARLRLAAIKLLEMLEEHEVGSARIETLQRLLALDPLRESAHRRLMLAYVAQGDRSLAVKQYEDCRKLLQDELGVEPAPETRELRLKIVANEISPSGGPGMRSVSALTADEPRLPSIAVLPLANLDGDPGYGFFSDGVTEDIISGLSRWRLLSVRSRSASFRYRGLAADIRQIARDLNVRYVVEGSVRRIGTRVRISVRLLDAETANHVWAERFDLDLSEIFAVQDQLVRTIVSTLAGRVQVAATEQIGRKPPSNWLAYECVLKGNALPWNDPAGCAEAKRLFERAIELDPDYGFAHCLLAAMHAKAWEDDWGESGESLERAYRLARRAVELDSNDSTCLTILGEVLLLQRSFDLALQYARRATELNANNQWNAADLGYVLLLAGDAESALDCFRNAREIDPYFGPSWYWGCLGLANMVLFRYQEAVAAFAQLPMMDYWQTALCAGCHARLLNTERATFYAAACLRARPDFSIARRMAKAPFRNPADSCHVAESLRLAGLPD